MVLLCIGMAGCSNREEPAPQRRPKAQRPDAAAPDSSPAEREPTSPPPISQTHPSIDDKSCNRCVAIGLSLRHPDGQVSVVGRIDSSGHFGRLFQPSLAWKRVRRGTYLIGDSIHWIANERDTIEIQHKQVPTQACVRKYRIRNGWLVLNSHAQVVALEDAPSIAARIDSLLRLGPSFAYTETGFDATIDPDECEFIPNAIDAILRSAPGTPRIR